MLTPISEFTDVISRGKTLIRHYNTGTLDTSTMTPKLDFSRRFDGSAAGTVQVNRVDAYNWTYVIPYAVTNNLNPDYMYELEISFEDGSGNCIPHGIVHYTVAPGVPHP